MELILRAIDQLIQPFSSWADLLDILLTWDQLSGIEVSDISVEEEEACLFPGLPAHSTQLDSVAGPDFLLSAFTYNCWFAFLFRLLLAYGTPLSIRLCF